MAISNETRIFIGILFITLPTIEFGGAFLLSQLGRQSKIIRTDAQGAFYRAGHAHAGVLVILAIIAQLVIEAGEFASPLSILMRFGFILPPILMPLGFFLGAPNEAGKRGPLAICIPIGAIILAVSTLGLGIGLLVG